ncbi:MAG TPA: winged helix-turn-helix domain-containing protein [Candidatus Acidoferrales bacterium]|nr:winged helix-turn-helix domain-containing protein [Candidatus Acidoferrales bacterium]
MATIPSNGPADRGVIAIRFGEFEYHTQRDELRKHGLRIRLQPQPLAILLALLDSPGTLVTREELRSRVWESGTFVDFEHGLNSAMKRVRDALCDSADKPEYIETVPGRGYRFIAAVEHIRAAAAENKSVEGSGLAVSAADPAKSLAPPGTDRTSTLDWRRTLALGALVVSLCAAATLIDAGSFGLRSRASARTASWVLVTRFDNRTGESQLDNVLDFALRSDLSNSHAVHVAAPERVQDTLRLMRKPPDTPVDEKTGREICLRDGGIGAVVTGRIEKLSGKYLVAISFVDAQTGTTLRSFAGEADNQQAILQTVNRLSEQLREHLGEAIDEIGRSNRQLERATTPSLRALQLFSAGSDLLADGIPSDAEAAAELFSQAIQLDPDFASAYTYLGWAELDTPNQGSAIGNFRRAVELADTASERERLFILLSWYGLELHAGDLDKAIHYGELLTSLYPDFYWGVQVQAMLLLNANRPDEAAAMFERGLRLRPNDLDWAVTAWEGFDGDSQQGFRGVRSDLAQMFRKKAEEIAAHSGDSALTGFWMPYLDASEKRDRGDAAGAAAALDNARPADGVLAHQLAVAYLALGKLRDGERVIQGAAEPEQLHMLVAFLRNGVGGLRSYARRHPVSAPLDGPGIIGLLYARIGDLRGDSPAIRELLSVGQRQAWHSAILGEEAMNRGQYALAIRELRDALASPNTSAQQMFLSDSLATALEREGDSVGAATVLQKSANEFADPLDGTLCPLVLEHLARTYRKVGDTARAAVLENHVKKLLEAADPDYSLDAQLGAAPTCRTPTPTYSHIP